MPTYEYQCKTCGHHFERVQRFADAPLTECPECGGQIRRVIHAAGIVFKGAGWYITDSRKSTNETTGPAKNESKGEAKSDAPGDTKGETKSESKSDSKSDSKESGASSPSSSASKSTEKAATD